MGTAAGRVDHMHYEGLTGLMRIQFMDRGSCDLEAIYDNGTMSTENKDGDFEKATEQNTLSGKTNAPKSSTKGTDSARQMLPESNQEHGGEKTTQCGSGFSNPTLSNLHQGIAKEEISDNSDECDRNPSYVKFKRTQYPCPYCNKVFLVKGNLTRHLEMHAGAKPYKCGDCGKNFRLMRRLLLHLRAHLAERPFQCNKCEKSFTRKGCFVQHQKTHLGKKPFQCTQCKKRFLQKGNLNRHQIIHSGERPYPCTECEKSFTRKVYLISHQRMHTENHTDTERETLDQCTELESNSSVQSNVNKCQKASSGERPNQCTECENSLEQINDHIKDHRTCEGEQPYPCTECEKIIVQNAHHIIQQTKHIGGRTGKKHIILARLLEVSVPNDYFILRHGENKDIQILEDANKK